MPGPDDPVFDDLDHELRGAVGGEFRRTAEEDEHDARVAALRSRTLEHVAYELLSRGDTVTVAAGSQRLHGTIIHAKGDLATIESPSSEVTDVHLDGPVVVRVVARTPQGGRARDRFGAESFVARLREFELDGSPVTLYAPAAGDLVSGTIGAVARDHVMVHGDEGDTWYLPIDLVAFCGHSSP